MATQESQVGIVPAPPLPPPVARPPAPSQLAPALPSFESLIQGGGLVIPVVEFTPSGQNRQFLIPVDFTAMAQPDGSWKSVLTRAAFLKLGPMAADPFGSIVSAVLYADKLGLDVLAKDVYVVDGKLAVSAEGKIKFADQSGKIESRRIDITIKGEKDFSYSEQKQAKSVKLPNLHAKVTVKLKGDDTPHIMEWELSDFFGGSSAWRTDTKSMFAKRALGKTLGILVPTGVDAEEIPSASEMASRENAQAIPSVAELRAASDAEKVRSRPAQDQDAPLVTLEK